MSAVIPDPALTDWVPLGGVGGGGSMIALQEVVLGAAAASIDFTNIPQGYRDLRLVVYGRGDTAATIVALRCRFNGDTGNNYDHQQLYGQAATVVAAEGIGAGFIFAGYLAAATAPAGAAGQACIDIAGYAGTTFHKGLASLSSTKSVNAAAGIIVSSCAGQWRNTAAINRIEVYPGAGNFVAGTRATLYGLAAPVTTLPLTGVRAVWGRVSGAGAILGGSGFTVVRTAAGQYTVTFNTPFANPPAVIVKHNTAVVQVTVESWVASVTANGFAVQATRNQTGSASNFTDYEWHFIAMEAA